MQLAAGGRTVHGEIPLVVGTAERISELAADWDALCDRLDAAPPRRPGWLSAWQEAFGAGRWEILVARRDGRMAGVMPLLRKGRRLYSPTNFHSPEWGPVAEDAAAERAITEEMLSRAPGRIDLGFLREEDPALSRITAAAESDGRRVVVRVQERSPYVRLEGDWDEFERGLPGKRRADLRRRMRRLEERGAIGFECEDGSGRLPELLEEGIEVEASGWEGRDGTPIAARDDTRLFYESVARWAAERGWLRLFFLRLDGRPIAFAYCLLHAGSLSVLKIGFDPAYSRFGPGLLLTREMLAHAFASGMRTYEFLGKPESYKLTWTQTCRDRVRLQAFPSGAAGLAGYLAWTRGRSFARWAMRRGGDGGLTPTTGGAG